MSEVMVVHVDRLIHADEHSQCGRRGCPCAHPPRLIQERLGDGPKFVGYDTAENAVVLAGLGKLAMRLSLSEAYELQQFLESVLPIA